MITKSPVRFSANTNIRELRRVSCCWDWDWTVSGRQKWRKQRESGDHWERQTKK